MTTQTKTLDRAFPKVILGQEAICPDGLGRVIKFSDKFPHEYICVSTYVDDRQCYWAAHNVQLIDPRGWIERWNSAASQSNRIWFDTEFIEDGKTIDLISIGMVRADGATYYAEVEECDLSRASPWVQANVLPHLTGQKKARAAIRDEIIAFCGEAPELWAYYASYDWVVLCQLFGTMMDLPSHWPMFCRDLKQLAEDQPLPEQSFDDVHHALADALWTRKAWLSLHAKSE